MCSLRQYQTVGFFAYYSSLPFELTSIPTVLPNPVQHHLDEVDSTPSIDTEAAQPSQAPGPQYFQTSTNLFGLSKKFYGMELPGHSPDESLTLSNFFDNPTEDDRVRPGLHSHPRAKAASLSPYPNQNSFELGDWYWNTGVQKSQSNFKALINIVGNPEFKPEEVRNTNWTRINTALGSSGQAELGGDLDSDWEWLDDGWKSSDINIKVPFHQRMDKPGPQSYVAGKLYHRSLVSVVKERLQSLDSGAPFHFEPYKLLWDLGGGSDEVRVHGEMYTSDQFLAMHHELLNSPPEPGCNAPRAIIPLMFWSDATHLSSFGQAQLWPLYLYFGNESKYERCKPSANLCSHIAYFQKVKSLSTLRLSSDGCILYQLPDSFNDFAASRTGGKRPSDALLAHCHREVFHAQWEILLDEEFIEAWKHGILIKCYDGIIRRFYLRIITYSADYPEK